MATNIKPLYGASIRQIELHPLQLLLKDSILDHCRHVEKVKLYYLF